MLAVTRIVEITKAARAGIHYGEYLEAMREIEVAAELGKYGIALDYPSDEVRRGVATLLGKEGFHTCRVGSLELRIRWDH